MDLTLVPFQQQREDGDGKHKNRHNPNPISAYFNLVKYKECMKNHAASIGGHANDGCGEFMPCADDNNLTCAACGCHRNFHRREGTSAASSARQHHTLHFEHLLLSPPPLAAAKSVTVSKKHLITSHDHSDDPEDDDHDRRSETPERGEVNHVGGLGSRAKNKRFRTKFTQEQKDRMLEFAEKIGWRINKNDDMALNQFCDEVGVKRNVLKVWMHNNKNAHRRRDVQEESTVGAPPPPAPPQAVGV
ncbi:zinc-finger homeodomain protein 2 [Ricinus communis]|uniref:Transcription factor, putative n=1 Tax=Ricinus communis TaxID=3988 RepID=B9T8B5_RICCO|nr:zinc-finger homeodomain protein 2 [Ricinus communis]EEF27897.1 transcription factor, putative [Ricinus communis]|eukprot:XP_002534484.1 zinc-finger homeodomain protein 2 [Ricinus communis]